jgi:hypothetical protein
MGFQPSLGMLFRYFFALFGKFVSAHFTEAVLIKKTYIFHRFRNDLGWFVSDFFGLSGFVANRENVILPYDLQ